MALSFSKAIEEVEETLVTNDEVLAYLKAHGTPELVKLVEKDLTATDVHQTTALGNEGRKKKKKTISTVGGKTVREAQADSDGEAEKRYWTADVEISKVDEDEQKFYGWASVVEENGQLLVDKQDDVILPDDLQKAAEEFVLYSRQQGDMHEIVGVGRMIASMVNSEQMRKTFPEAFVERPSKVGWLVGFHVDDKAVWKSMKAGDRLQLSIGGSGDRVDI